MLAKQTSSTARTAKLKTTIEYISIVIMNLRM